MRLSRSKRGGIAFRANFSRQAMALSVFSGLKDIPPPLPYKQEYVPFGKRHWLIHKEPPLGAYRRGYLEQTPFFPFVPYTWYEGAS